MAAPPPYGPPCQNISKPQTGRLLRQLTSYIRHVETLVTNPQVNACVFQNTDGRQGHGKDEHR